MAIENHHKWLKLFWSPLNLVTFYTMLISCEKAFGAYQSSTDLINNLFETLEREVDRRSFAGEYLIAERCVGGEVQYKLKPDAKPIQLINYFREEECASWTLLYGLLGIANVFI